MRRAAFVSTLIVVASASFGASAQPAAPEDSASTLEDDDEPAPKPSAAKSDPIPEPAPDEAPLPPPAPPRPGDQQPAPYFPAPEQPRQRLASIGPDVGVTYRSSSRSDGSYAAGASFGAHARAELATFLGLRAHFSRTSHAVTLDEGSLGLPGTRYDQPDVTVTTIGGRLEPTLVITPTLRVWLGLGVAWGRLVAPIPSTSGALSLTTAERTGVLLDWTGSLGGALDLIPGRLGLTLDLAGGLSANRSGTVFGTAQAIDQNGQSVKVGPLPEPESVLAALLGIEALF